MRIPLDYYRILGVPPQIDPSQLEQAYRDRLLQLPRREYSDYAIESRQQLLTAAYQVLSQPDQRAEYDRTLRPAADDSQLDSLPVELEIPPEQFLGALLVLFEQGEHEQIVTICLPYIGNNGRTNNSGSLSGSLQPIESGNIPHKADIVLTTALSSIELGKQEWHERRQEDASVYFEAARDILIREDLFPQLQGEVERDLDKLRPYRVLHLVALPLERRHAREREQGILLLMDMLEVCSTDSIACKERFGLSKEGMLKFIDQIRRYMTTDEQQQLFGQLAAESAQPLCTYLHVYALMARGFGNHGPSFIQKAQEILKYRLADRCEVRMEQAICSLLLGQREEVSRILDSLPESEQKIVIRQQSQGAADLFPGLYWYVQEEWLPREILCYFRDLNERPPTLLDYFEDRHVQTYIENLPAANRVMAANNNYRPQLIDVPISGDLSGGLSGGSIAPPPMGTTGLTSPPPNIGNIEAGDFAARWQPANQLGMGSPPAAERVVAPPPIPEIVAPMAAEPIAASMESSPTDEPADASYENVIEFEQERRRRRPQSKPLNTMLSIEADRRIDEEPQTIDRTTGTLVPVGDATTSHLHRNNRGKLSRRRRRLHIDLPRFLLATTGSIACGAAVIVVAQSAWRGIQTSMKSGQTPTTTSSPMVPSPSPMAKTPNKPLPDAPKPTAAPALAELSPVTAQQLVERWLSAKAKSLGKDYQTSQLPEILAEPVLARAIDRSQDAKKAGIHWLYQHKVAVESVPKVEPKTTATAIEAKVVEEAKFYQQDRPIVGKSYKKDLRVKYDLIRKADRWYIKNMAVVN